MLHSFTPSEGCVCQSPTCIYPITNTVRRAVDGARTHWRSRHNSDMHSSLSPKHDRDGSTAAARLDRHAFSSASTRSRDRHTGPHDSRQSEHSSSRTHHEDSPSPRRKHTTQSRHTTQPSIAISSQPDIVSHLTGPTTVSTDSSHAPYQDTARIDPEAELRRRVLEQLRR